ncbi:lyase family protein [Gordonia sp. NB41Y]|uniref:lyase family protein n=1 Tax=Gordonia sp. NB41Y TaxID=875808 RepID=UPI0006B1F527|nr:lyase family protein [Gordonia sp. NB41Y]EMP11561.2 3-carboxy-cis,cis-muconate cycloisomerase [Gordonia sp. NB41Y]WLP90750.1 lyase family protein [Gordonia sp. NB41Y]
MTDLLWPGDHHAGDVLTDAAVADAMIRVEAAWSTALTEAGVAPADALVDPAALRALIGDGDLDRIAIEAESGGNPVIPLVKLLRSGLGESATAQWLHRGLTSQDVVDTALMCCSATAFAEIGGELTAQIRILSRYADRFRATPMVARTLTQYAVPMTFGLKAAQWLSGVLDASELLAGVRFPLQIGGAAGTSAALLELAGPGHDPARLYRAATEVAARELGLEAVPPWHSVRTAICRVGDASVACTDAWGHIANDVLTLSRPEIAEVGEGAGGSSSTMPHKSNPVLSVLIRRAALTGPPLASTLHLAAADAVDERTPGAWHAEWDTLRQLVRRTLVAARQTTRLLDKLQIHEDRMASRLQAAGQAVTSEQKSMAGIAGLPPAADYLGATQHLIDAQLERARKVIGDRS